MPPSRSRGKTVLAVAAAVLAATTTSLLPSSAQAGTPATTARPLSERAVTALSPQEVGARQAPLLKVATDVMTLSRQGAAPDFAGYAQPTISVTADDVTISWKGALPERLKALLARDGRTVDIRLRTAPYSWRELQAQTRRIVAGRSALLAQGLVLTQAGPAAESTGVTVGIAPASTPGVAARSRAATDVPAATRIMNSLHSGPAPLAVTALAAGHSNGGRQHDSQPWWGGARIVRAGNIVCSSGFSVYQNSTHYLLTAGHCGGINTNYQTGDYFGSGDAVGNEANRDPNGDTAIIAVTGDQGWIYDKGWDSTVGESVIGYQPSVPGTLTCTEGATSGVRCGAKVAQTGVYEVFANDDGTTFGAYNEVYAHSTSNAQVNAGGDSGGPVIINSGVSGQVYGTGTISGAGTGVGCSSIDPNVVPHCYDDVWYEDLGTTLNHWGASLS